MQQANEAKRPQSDWSRFFLDAAKPLFARFSPLVDGESFSRTGYGLYAMLLPAEVVRHVPEFQLSRTRNAVTAFDVPHGHLLSVATAPDLAAHHGSHDRTAGGGNILTAPAAELVPQNSADDGADDRSANIAPASRLDDLFALDPATLLGRTDHGMDGSDVRLVKPFVATATDPLPQDGNRGIPAIIDANVPSHTAHRRNAVVQPHRGQRRISTGTQDHAVAVEARILADFPAAIDNLDRRRPIIEAIEGEITDLFFRGIRPARKPLVFVIR